MKRSLLGTIALMVACAVEGTGPTFDGTRIVLFGDSNTDLAWGEARNYVGAGYLNPNDPPKPGRGLNLPESLAGKIEMLDPSIRAVNHGIAGTNTGNGKCNGCAVHARTMVNGVTRFEAEVLGIGYPWHGTELPTPIFRTYAFVPGPNDFAYISMGTNDGNWGMTSENLRWMIAQWSKRYQPDHLFVTTLAPALHNAIPSTNDSIRVIVKETGAQLIDLAAYTSDDNGRTWRDESYRVDELHYSEKVRLWLAQEILSRIGKLKPCDTAGCAGSD
jgi:hypothetical protein